MLLNLVLVVLSGAVAFAQQYAGRAIAVPELPAVPGAELAYFNIKDNNGGNVTLLNYFSLPGGRRQTTSQVQRAVVNIHGVGNGVQPQPYFSALYQALPKATALDSAVDQNTVAMMAPYFVTTAAKLQRGDLVAWEGHSWFDGGTSVFPGGHPVSSYDVLDQIIQYFNDRRIYPNLKEIVIAGHSMGAQMVQRYAAVGKELLLPVPVVYWVANPSSFVWLDASRPLPTDDCPEFNDWHAGLANYTVDYERAFVRTSGQLGGVRTRYALRHIAYARGLNDFGDFIGDGCAPYTTGANRGERMYNFIDTFPPDSGDTIDYLDGLGHDAHGMAASESGIYRLFLDNFSGNGSRHANIGVRGPPTRPP